MTNRRSFLSLLASAPVAAPIAAKEAINQAAEGIRISGAAGAIYSGEVSLPQEPQTDGIWRAIREALDAEEAQGFFGDEPIPVSIASKKSWSAVFKASEAHKVHVARRRRSNALQRIAYGDDPYHIRAAKLIAMGLKVKL